MVRGRVEDEQGVSNLAYGDCMPARCIARTSDTLHITSDHSQAIWLFFLQNVDAGGDSDAALPALTLRAVLWNRAKEYTFIPGAVIRDAPCLDPELKRYRLSRVSIDICEPGADVDE